MADTIKLRRDTAANWTSANPILAEGEKGIETDTQLEKVGDGITAWLSLPYSRVECLSETGQSQVQPMSQKAVTDKFNETAVYDISAAHSGTQYASLSAALGTNGTNIPQDVRRGGMAVKFIQSSDNSYKRFNLIADEFTTDVTKWQGVEEEPKKGSRNLVSSNGIANTYGEYIQIPDWFYAFADKFQNIIEAIDNKGNKHLFFDLIIHKDLDVANDVKIGGKIINIDLNNKIHLGDNTYPSDIHSVEETYEYLYVIRIGKNVLFTIKNNGEINWFKGVPKPIKDYITQEAKLRKSKEWNIFTPAKSNLGLFERNSLTFHNDVNSMLLSVTRNTGYYNDYTSLIDNAKSVGASIIRFIIYDNVFNYTSGSDLIEPSTPISLNSEVVAKYNDIFTYAQSLGIDVLLTTSQLRYRYFDELSTTDINNYFTIISEIVTEFHSKVKYWEFSNEIDWHRATIQQMYDFQKRYYNLVKGIDNTAIVLGYGMSTLTQDEVELIRYYDYDNYVDIVNLHRYDSKKMFENLNNFYNILNNLLRNKPCWLTEYCGKRLESGYDGGINANSEKGVALVALKDILTATSLGVSKCFYWALEHILNHEVKTSLQYIYTLFNAATSYPTMTQFEGINIVSWESAQGGCFALWLNVEQDVDIKIRYDISAGIYDYKGNEITNIDKNHFLVTDDVVFIIGTNEIMFNLNF